MYHLVALTEDRTVTSKIYLKMSKVLQWDFHYPNTFVPAESQKNQVRK